MHGSGLKLLAAFIAMMVAACQLAAPPPTDDHFLLFFESEAAVVTPDANAVIDRAAAAIRANPPQTVAIYGFADPRGDFDTNRRLSAQRARAVADALVAAGVPDSLVMPRGLGETETTAKASDLDPEGRRAEIVLVR